MTYIPNDALVPIDDLRDVLSGVISGHIGCGNPNAVIRLSSALIDAEKCRQYWLDHADDEGRTPAPAEEAK